jgi:predicted phosphodiesterase
MARSRHFHEVRPSAQGLRSNYRQQPHGNQRFQPLPPPTGQPPYHLALDQVLPPEQLKAIQDSGRILLHVAGDTGGVKAPQSQQIVAMAMEQQFEFADVALRPAFFYHLGDVVYYFGEAKEYFSQFYDPYVHYPAPIFAIPGNHDGDVTDGSDPSLTAFVNNLCAPAPHITPEAGETSRDAMTQPNVYWTLEAPFVTFVGLYSNVPEGGQIDDGQLTWFVNELRTAPQDKALVVAVHHPPYSADSHHSGSQHIEEALDSAFNQAGRMADVVLSGHVHNYQRFTRAVSGRHIPYIVAGAGGYWHLHYMSKQADGSALQYPFQMPDGDLILESARDNRHGFMRMMVTDKQLSAEYWTVSRPQESWRAPAQPIDGFVLDLQQHRLVKGTNLG